MKKNKNFFFITSISVIFICLLGIILKIDKKDEEKKILYNGTSLLISVDGQSSSTLPTSENYYLTSYTCDNESTELTWDRTSYKLNVSNGTNETLVSCNLTFKSKPLLSEMKVGSYVDYTGTGGTVGADNVACQNGAANNDSSLAETDPAESPNSCKGENARQSSDTSGKTYGYCSAANYKFYTTGWRLAYVENNKPVLISAGSPECNTRDVSAANATYMAKANANALKYCNDSLVDGDCSCQSTTNGQCQYASDDAWAMSDEDFYKITKLISGYGKRLASNSSALGDSGGSLGTTLACLDKYSYLECGYANDLIDNGGRYWFAAMLKSDSSAGLYWEAASRFISDDASNTDARGLRPLINLSSTIYVTGGDGTPSSPYTIANSIVGNTTDEPNAPNLDNGNLIPVYYDETNSVWRKADSSNTNNSWYDYDNKKWANAIMKNSNTVLDLMGNANYGTVSANAVWDKDNKTVTTTGATNSYVDLGLINHEFGSNISMAIRIKFDGLDSDDEYFGNLQSGGLGLYIDSSKYLAFQLYNGSWQKLATTEEVKTDTWYTIVATYDGTVMKVYLDGREVGSKELAGVTITKSAAPFRIGGNPPAASGNSSTHAKVTASHALIFGRALSASEVASDYSNIPNPTNTTSLLSYSDFSDGDDIPNDTVVSDKLAAGNLGFVVWIPRFKYRVWNITRQAGDETTYAYQAYTKGIDIEWEANKKSTGNVRCSYDTSVAESATTLSDTCVYNGTDTITTGSGNTNYTNAWYTHPAFTFGGAAKTGFWIGKFETSGTAAAPTVLPDQAALVSVNISGLFTASKIFQTYGLSNNVDAHMLTNLEWGAVAYLTHSNYGLCSSGSCADVYINDSSGFYTGRSAGIYADASTTSTYSNYNYKGYALDTNGSATSTKDITKVASTTRNVTGVYGMSGGANEYVMGNMVNSSNKFNASNSGTSWNGTSTLDIKYYDSYSYSTTQLVQKTHNRARLGDATSEVLYSINGTFANNEAWNYYGSTIGAGSSLTFYVDSVHYSWVLRGGAYNNNKSGLFFSGRGSGGVGGNTGTRLAIS